MIILNVFVNKVLLRKLRLTPCIPIPGPSHPPLCPPRLIPPDDPRVSRGSAFLISTYSTKQTFIPCLTNVKANIRTNYYAFIFFKYNKESSPPTLTCYIINKIIYCSLRVNYNYNYKIEDQ